MHKTSTIRIFIYGIFLAAFLSQNAAHAQVSDSKEYPPSPADLVDKVATVTLATTQQPARLRRYSVRVLEVKTSNEESIESVLLVRVDRNANYEPRRFVASEISRLLWHECIYAYDNYTKTLVCSNPKHADAFEDRLKLKQEEAKLKLKEEERLAKAKQEEDERIRLAKEKQEERERAEAGKQSANHQKEDKKNETPDWLDPIKEQAPEILFELGKFMVSSMFNIPNDRVPVNGYYRRDGTYVAPHTRSAPGKASHK